VSGDRHSPKEDAPLHMLLQINIFRSLRFPTRLPLDKRGWIASEVSKKQKKC
jgi:hypothetical protein